MLKSYINSFQKRKIITIIKEIKDEVKMEIEENSKKILIQITISTIINQNEGEKLFSQKCELTEVKRIEDPAITF